MSYTSVLQHLADNFPHFALVTNEVIIQKLLDGLDLANLHIFKAAASTILSVEVSFLLWLLLLCDFKFPFWENFFPQSIQLNGLAGR